MDDHLHAVFADARDAEVFPANDDSVVALFGLSDGALRYVVPMASQPCEMALDPSTDTLAVHINDGRVINNDGCADAADTKLLLLDAGTGHVRHTVSIAGTFVSMAAVRGHLFVVTTQYEFGGTPSPATSRVSMVDLHSGAGSRTVSVVHDAGPLAVDERRGLVFITGSWRADCQPAVQAGQVRVLAAESGEELGRVAIGSTPSAMAFDSRAGRLLVVGSGEAPGWPGCYGQQPATPSLSVVDLRVTRSPPGAGARQR